MHRKYLFSSKRLGFRNWQDEDIPKMVAISADVKIMEFFPATATAHQTEIFIGKMQKSYHENGFCYFAVDLLETKEFIGFIGLQKIDYKAEFTPNIDIGWRLKEAAWGKGYATEGAKRCLTYAFEELNLEQVVATATVINSKSIKVMDKIGMSKKIDFIHPKLQGNKRLEKCVCYEILR